MEPEAERDHRESQGRADDRRGLSAPSAPAALLAQDLEWPVLVRSELERPLLVRYQLERPQLVRLRLGPRPPLGLTTQPGSSWFGRHARRFGRMLVLA